VLSRGPLGGTSLVPEHNQIKSPENGFLRAEAAALKLLLKRKKRTTMRKKTFM